MKRHNGRLWYVGVWCVEFYLDFHGILIGVNWWMDKPVAVYVHLGPFIAGVFHDPDGARRSLQLARQELGGKL